MNHPSEQSAKRTRRRLRRRWLWRVGFGVVVLVGLVLVVEKRAEWEEFFAKLGALDPWWLTLAGLLQVGTYVADAEIWERVLIRMGQPRPFRMLLRFSLAKFFVDQFVPTGGVSGSILVMRSLERGGVDRSISVSTLVVRLFSYYLAYGIGLGLAMAIAARFGHVPVLLLAAGALLALVFLGLPIVALLVVRDPDRGIPLLLQRPKLLKRLRPSIRMAARETPRLAQDPWLLGATMALQLAIFALDGLTLWVLALALDLEVSLAATYAAFMLGFLAGSIGSVPGGLGTIDAGTVAGLTLFGVPLSGALAATLLYRGFTFWAPLVPGFFAARKEAWR